MFPQCIENYSHIMGGYASISPRMSSGPETSACVMSKSIPIPLFLSKTDVGPCSCFPRRRQKEQFFFVCHSIIPPSSFRSIQTANTSLFINQRQHKSGSASTGRSSSIRSSARDTRPGRSVCINPTYGISPTVSKRCLHSYWSSRVYTKREQCIDSNQGRPSAPSCKKQNVSFCCRINSLKYRKNTVSLLLFYSPQSCPEESQFLHFLTEMFSSL